MPAGCRADALRPWGVRMQSSLWSNCTMLEIRRSSPLRSRATQGFTVRRNPRKRQCIRVCVPMLRCFYRFATPGLSGPDGRSVPRWCAGPVAETLAVRDRRVGQSNGAGNSGISPAWGCCRVIREPRALTCGSSNTSNDQKQRTHTTYSVARRGPVSPIKLANHCKALGRWESRS